jgi:hypothetical protein
MQTKFLQSKIQLTPEKPQFFHQSAICTANVRLRNVPSKLICSIQRLFYFEVYDTIGDQF